MKWPILFVLLNVIDLAFTQFMLDKESVSEANPIINHLLQYGWGWVWAFKLGAMGLILGCLYVWRSRESFTEIMMVSTWVVAGLLLYMFFMSGVMEILKNALV